MLIIDVNSSVLHIDRKYSNELKLIGINMRSNSIAK